MRPKNAIGKTLFLQPIVPLKPNPDHHRTDDSPAKELTTGRSVRERARARAPVPRKTSRIRRSRSRRLKRPLAPARRSAAVCGGLGSRAKKEPKKAYRDFQAIRRKGVVQGQSRQALP